MTRVSEVDIVKINELNEIFTRNPDLLLAAYNPSTGETQSIKASTLTGGETVDITWKNNITYNTGDIVEYQDKFWKSNLDNNLNNLPFDGVFWREVSKSEGDGTIDYWRAGVYFTAPVIVVRNDSLYILSSTVTVPYESTNFEAEFAAGNWLSIASNLFNYIDFNPQPTPPAHQAGRVFFDTVEDALTYYNSESEISLQIGRELWVRCVNNTGATILNGTNVYIQTSDITTKLPSINIANCCEYTKSRIIGKVTHNIENNTIGYVAFFGIVRDYDTTSFNEGDTLYLTPAGGDSNVFPIGGAYTTRIGTVLESSINGSVQLNVSTSEYTVETLQQTGFPDVSNLNRTFNNTTRTLTVSPVDGISVRYYEKGVKYLITGAGDTLQISDVTGLHFIYYSNGSLTEVVDPTLSQEVSILTNNPVVTSIYWRAGDRQIYFGDQAHNSIGYGSRQIALDHIKTGARYVSGSGLGFNDFIVDANGSLNSHAQFSIASGQIVDSDIISTTNSFAATSGVEIAYLDSSLNWQRASNPGYSFLNTGTGRVAYQNPTLGGLVECPDNTYVLYHFFANNDLQATRTVLSVPGLAAHTSILNAEAAADEEAATILSAAPIQEFVLVGIVIYQTRNSYSNTVKARVVSTSDGDNYIDKRTSGISGSGGGGSTPLTTFSDSEFKLFDDITLNELSYVLDNLTQNISWTIQDKSGTPALLDDIPEQLSSDYTISINSGDTITDIQNALLLVPDNLNGYKLILEFESGITHTLAIGSNSIINFSRFTNGTIIVKSDTEGAIATLSNTAPLHVTFLAIDGDSDILFKDLSITPPDGGYSRQVSIINTHNRTTSFINVEFKFDNLTNLITDGYMIDAIGGVFQFESCTFSKNSNSTRYSILSNDYTSDRLSLIARFFSCSAGINTADYIINNASASDDAGTIFLQDSDIATSDTRNTDNVIVQRLPATGGHIIQDEGTPLTQRSNLNFVGDGVTVTDDSGNDATVVTIGGGSSFPEWDLNTATSWDGTSYSPDMTSSDVDQRTVNNAVTSLTFTAPSNVSTTKRRNKWVVIDNSGNSSAIATISFTGYTFPVGVEPTGLAAGAKAVLELDNNLGSVVRANWTVDE